MMWSDTIYIILYKSISSELLCPPGKGKNIASGF